MKRLSLLPLFLMLAAIGLHAQTQEPTMSIDSARSASFGPDHLFDGVSIGISSAEITEKLASDGWTVRKKRKNSIELRRNVPEGVISTLIVGLASGKARTVAATVTGRRESASLIADELARLRTLLLARADDVDEKGTRTTFLHRASDGRLVRTVLNRLSATRFTLEAGVR